MTSDTGEEDILEARKMKESHRWLEAAKIYEQALTSSPRSVSSAAKIYEQVGFYYWHASRQAEKAVECGKLVQEAVEAYENASRLYGNENDFRSLGKASQCSAAARYLSSWIAPDPSERRRLLKEACGFGYKGLESYEKANSELDYVKMCNDLLLYLLESLRIASDWKEMIEVAKEGIDCADKAIAAAKLQDKSELLRAYSLASLQSWQAHTCLGERRKELIERSLSYSEKGLELSEEVDNPYYTAMAKWAAALCNLLFTEKADLSLKYANEMLREGAIVRDNYLKGVASYILAFTANWIVLREADPDKRKKGHEKTIQYAEDAVRYLQSVCQDFFIAETCLFYGETYSYLARDVLTSREEKRAILEKAVGIGRRGLEHAKRSGSPDATGSVLHALSKALHFYSNIESGKERKRKLLEEALIHRKEYVETVERAFPADDWVCGVGKTYEGLIQVDLARMETDKEKKRTIFESAVEDMENGISRCKKSMLARPVPTLFAVVGRFEDWLGEALNELYSLTEDRETLGKAVEVYEGAAENFEKVGLPSRVAECYWKIARNQSLLGNHKKAADSFESSFRKYQASGEKIPHLKEFYNDYSLYMQAWSEVEKARHYHIIQEYSQAMKHYEKAAELHMSSKSWKYLASNYNAWTQLEHGEILSRDEKSEKAMEAFQKATKLFREAKTVLQSEFDKIESRDEKELVEDLIEASDLRREYCVGRISLEEAKILDKKGDHMASSEKFGSAADTFREIAKNKSEQSRREFEPIIFLCLAWQKMMLAESRASSETYEEAAELFEKAKEHTLDQTTSLIAAANSSFCKALASGTEFEASMDANFYSAASHHLEGAAHYYLKAGVETASEYVKATQRLFDAYVYMDTAKKERNPEKKARYCTMAEKVLQTSAVSFQKARHPEKSDQVHRLLDKVREERELAMSLSEILHAPTIASSTVSFATPTSREETAVGLERFEHANVQANLIIGVEEVKIGERFNLEMHVSNVGKEGVLLSKIEEVVPAGFELVSKPDYCTYENTHINMKGRRLEPLKTEEIKLVLRPLGKGSFAIQPKILCVDETGFQITSEPEPVTIEVGHVILEDRVATGYMPLDDLLFGGIPKNYMVILTSPSCDERDTMIKSFLETGTKNGEVIFYITIQPLGLEKLAEKFQSNFFLFICNPLSDTLVKSLPNIVKLKGVENLTNINIALMSAFRTLDELLQGPKRACIDIVSDVLLQHHAVQTRRWLTGLIPEFKSRGFTTLAVMNPQMHPSEEVHAILGLFDGEVSIRRKETQRGLEKFLRVEKMYNQKYLESEMLLKKGNE